MRRKDRNAGSIKALIVLALLAGNIVVALPHRSRPRSPEPGAQTPHFVGRLHEAAWFDEAVRP
jgi:hypothetical protein